jgi:hypothetical protein
MKVRFSKWVENGIGFVSLSNNGISSLLQLVVKHIINAEERRLSVVQLGDLSSSLFFG